MCKLDLVKLRSAQKVPRFDIRHPFEVTKVVLKEFSSWQKCSSCLEMAWMQHYTSVFYLVWAKQSLPLHPTPTHLKGKKKTTDKNLIGVQKSRHLARTFISWQLAVLEKRHSFCYKCSQLKAFWNGQTKQQSINEQICLQQTNILAMVLPLFLASAPWQDYIR